jgi:hypothetical protein
MLRKAAKVAQQANNRGNPANPTVFRVSSVTQISMQGLYCHGQLPLRAGDIFRQELELSMLINYSHHHVKISEDNR